jgi:hypothetical protein
MKFIDANEVRARVVALPDWAWCRAEAEAAWNAKMAADAVFAEAQAAVSELFARVMSEMMAEMEQGDQP